MLNKDRQALSEFRRHGSDFKQYRETFASEGSGDRFETFPSRMDCSSS